MALLFGLAVFIHEFGHYIAARLLGMKVDAFSIGFGPAIVKWRRKGIEYKIGCFPLGGYVALPQLDPAGMEKIQGGDGPDDSLPPASAWRRVVVALAGPLGNLVLAVFLAWLIFLLPQGRMGGPDTIVGMVAEGSPAEAAGFLPGDKILAVNGTQVASWNDFAVECHLSGDVNAGVNVTVERAGSAVAIDAPVSASADFKTLQIEGLSRKIPCIVGQTLQDSSAAAAGVEPGDEITALDGTPLASPSHMIELVSKAGENQVTLSVKRGDRALELAMTPVFDAEAGRPLVGVVFADPDASRSPWLVYRNPWRQLKADAGSIARIFRALLAPRAKGEAGRAAEALGGPVMIFFMLWSQVMAGLVNSLAFLRFLCVNLAIINLLPLPVLDGGHIVFALWEMATRRKPNRRLVEYATNAFAILLLGLMVLLVFRDAVNLHRIFKPRAEARQEATDAAEDNAEGDAAAQAEQPAAANERGDTAGAGAEGR